MKGIRRAVSAAVTCIIGILAISARVFAADVSIDVSGAAESSGEWDMAFSYTTPVVTEKEGFDPRWMTGRSEVIVGYSYEGKPPNGYPAELIWQTWQGGPAPSDPDVKKSWNRIRPYEYDENTARFSYADIVSTYGTENFSTVYAVNICDTGVKLRVNSLTVTNCNVPWEEETEAPEVTESYDETEETAAAETEMTEETSRKVVEPETEPVTETEAPPAEEVLPEKKKGGLGAVIGMITGALCIAAGVLAFRHLVLKHGKKDRYY